MEIVILPYSDRKIFASNQIMQIINKQFPNNALFQAIKNGDLETVKSLLNSELDLDKTDECGYKPLLLAVNFGNIEIAKLLLEAGASSDCCDAQSMVNSIENRRPDLLLFLIEAGIDINQRLVENEDRTVLTEAARAGDINIVKTLVEHGADVNAVSRKNHFALMNAACQGWQEIYDYLAPLTSPQLRYRAEKELPAGLAYRKRKDDKLLGEFITAAATGDIDTVRAAIEKKVNVNAFDVDGSTALFIAANWGYVSIVRALIEAGANVNLGAEDNRETPLMIAASRTALKKNKVYVGELGQVEVIKLLIEAGANVNAKTDEGWTALIAAANAGSVEAVELLLKAGANAKHKTRSRETALNMALERGYQEIIQLLRAAGAK